MNNFLKVLEMVRNRSGSIGIGTKSDPTKFGTHWKSRSDMGGWFHAVPKLSQIGSNFWNLCGDSDNAMKIGPRVHYFGSISCTFVVFLSRASKEPKT